MLHIQELWKHYDGVPILKGVSLQVAQGEIVCLLGPSGCGKTTLLRLIAGLEATNGGQILLEGQDITRRPVHQRDFGLMFQDFALFPHLNVARNVAFGLEMQGRMEKDERQQRVDEVLALVGLAGFQGRDVNALSGGERQRVALARSLAPRPRLLMLDEPLGSLDAALRDRLVVDLRDIIHQAGVTAIYVTHDQQEAFAVADRIAVMNAGQMEQVAPPQTLYLQPHSSFVARFLGLNNLVPITGWQDGQAQTPLGSFAAPESAESLLLHPAYAEVLPPQAGAIPLEVQRCVFRGYTVQLSLRHASGVTLRLPFPVRQLADSAPGTMLHVHFAEAGIVPLQGTVEFSPESARIEPIE